MLQELGKGPRADAASSLRAAGTVTRIRPMSRGGCSPGRAGSLPVSRQCSGWPVAPAPASGSAAAARGSGVPVEGVPEAELVLVEAGLPLSLLEALLYGPALPGDLDQDGQGHQGGGVA